MELIDECLIIEIPLEELKKGDERIKELILEAIETYNHDAEQGFYDKKIKFHGDYEHGDLAELEAEEVAKPNVFVAIEFMS